jgi:hypothetical protein
MRRTTGFALAILALVTSTRSHAQSAAGAQQLARPSLLATRQAVYTWDGDLLRASYSYRDVLADPGLIKKLSTGLPVVIAMRAYLYREGDDVPVALAPRVCRVVFDLWDEVYRVHVSEPEHDRDQAVVLDGVLRLCTEARDLAVVRRALVVPGRTYFLGVVVEVNPVSPEIVDQMRRWMSRPAGSTSLGPSDALFGSFVQLFARQLATSDAMLTFRTQGLVP